MGIFDRLGETITVLRLLRRLSQGELAERAGIRPNQISRYETGAVQPQLAQLERILEALDVGIAEFLFTMNHLDRTARLLEQSDAMPQEEELARRAVIAYWENVTDLHLRISREAMRVVSEEFTGGEAKAG
ncbi:MAG TPA: helix-turn-helix transcriptional regulator [Thermoanaerobaculia bacterium]|nr:helix-turn-helix transcriptional regulator [Thermoanaerobaculia bacterium]